MNKQLLDKIEQALDAQQDTIQRQQAMLDSKDKDIAHLQSLLEQLTTTQTQHLERLPTLHEQLKNTISEQSKAYKDWISQRNMFLEQMNSLTTDTIGLCNTQIQLAELMKQYQSTIALESTLSSDTKQLESKLDDLASSQEKIMNSQRLLKKQQEQLQKQLNN